MPGKYSFELNILAPAVVTTAFLFGVFLGVAAGVDYRPALPRISQQDTSIDRVASDLDSLTQEEIDIFLKANDLH